MVVLVYTICVLHFNCERRFDGRNSDKSARKPKCARAGKWRLSICEMQSISKTTFTWNWCLSLRKLKQITVYSFWDSWMLIFIRQSAKIFLWRILRSKNEHKWSENWKFSRTYMLPFLSNLGFLANLFKFVHYPSNLLSKVKSPCTKCIKLHHLADISASQNIIPSWSLPAMSSILLPSK